MLHEPCIKAQARAVDADQHMCKLMGLRWMGGLNREDTREQDVVGEVMHGLGTRSCSSRRLEWPTWRRSMYPITVRYEKRDALKSEDGDGHFPAVS